ncbi:hypothetical protein NLI96_g5603 [Meripilus lineatus]|uniref:Protein kinase domain-containing protein n=1 Tax=Meripilus lineatus TaxID=2056292 RepID=A0AAD5V4S2_9APHY|nr:hypothetical protein NLI96_g5603 [Physisporinus lineatus]
MAFLDIVKERYRHEPGVYQRLLSVLHEYQSQRTDHLTILQQVAGLFWNNLDLLQAFNAFTSSDYRIEISVTIVTPKGVITQSAELLRSLVFGNASSDASRIEEETLEDEDDTLAIGPVRPQCAETTLAPVCPSPECRDSIGSNDDLKIPVQPEQPSLQFEQGIKAIEDLISPVLLSEDIEDATLKLGLTPQLSQIIVDRLQNTISGKEMGLSKALKFTRNSHKIQRIMTTLCLAHSIVPASLRQKGVVCNDKDSCSGGSYADIYRGLCGSREIALKRLRNFGSAECLPKELLRELLIWGNLSHPHVAPLLGVDNSTFKHSTCLVLPWMKNGSLREYLRKLRADTSVDEPTLWLKVRKWIHQIALGLDYVHSKGVVHGDLRADNILVDEDENVYISDFGLAVYAQAGSTKYGSSRGGNVRWLAPELIDPEQFGSDSTRPTFASDIYSLGCLCVELLTGRAPFHGCFTDAQVVKQVVCGKRPHPPTPSEYGRTADLLWSLARKCWGHDPCTRPSSRDVLSYFLVHFPIRTTNVAG